MRELRGSDARGAEGPVQDKRFRQMLDAAPDAIVVVDQRGRVVALNRETERLFGWTDAELLGEPSRRLITPAFQKVYDALGVSGGESPTPAARKRPAETSLPRSRCVAATTRTSTRLERESPTRRSSPSWITRRSRLCTEGLASPISSRKRVP